MDSFKIFLDTLLIKNQNQGVYEKDVECIYEKWCEETKQIKIDSIRTVLSKMFKNRYVDKRKDFVYFGVGYNYDHVIIKEFFK